jgi:hypothetical protein
VHRGIGDYVQRGKHWQDVSAAAPHDLDNVLMPMSSLVKISNEEMRGKL